VWLDRQDLHDEIRTLRLPLNELDTKILATVDKSPFESIPSIAETLGVAHSTMLLHLHDCIDFRSFHLHWALYILMHHLCKTQKEYTKATLSFRICNDIAFEKEWTNHYIAPEQKFS
jgi:hypothetical protein